MSPSSRICLVTHRPMSVEPASSVASGCAARSCDQFVQRARRVEAAAVEAVGAAPCASRCSGAQRARPAAARSKPTARQFDHALRGIDDRAGSRCSGTGCRTGRRRSRSASALAPFLLQVHAPQGHHEARRAKAALRAVAFDHRLLHRMQGAVGLLQVFHGEQRLAVQRGRELDAGIDRLQRELAVLAARR